MRVSRLSVRAAFPEYSNVTAFLAEEDVQMGFGSSLQQHTSSKLIFAYLYLSANDGKNRSTLTQIVEFSHRRSEFLAFD
jgi:hypothetical protein